MLKRLLAALALMLVALPAAAQTVTLDSPGRVLKVTMTLNGEGRMQYRIDRRGKPVVADSQLGFLFTDQPQMLRNFEVVRTDRRDHDERWRTPWGEDRTVRDHYKAMTVSMREKTGLKRSIALEFRAYDDGIGFRYRFDGVPANRTTNIAEELTQFRMASDGRAWWAPAFESNREEYLYNATQVSGIGTAQTPLTMVLADRTHVSLHEAALIDYSGMNVARAEGTLLKAVLTPSSTGAKVSRTGAFTTPWRMVTIAPDAPSLYAARNMVMNLNEPNKLGDVSWVTPRKYVGIWWGMHLETQSWASGPKHGATTANALKLIDFASANGIPGMLVEGWNVGWDGDWFANGQEFSFTKPYPDFDMPRIAAYAKSKGVHLIGHHETSANIAHYESQMEAGFDYYRSLGIDAVKTGYVSDAGGVQAKGPDGRIRFEWHEGQVMARHHLKVVTEAAKRRIAVNAHEPIKDSGLRRTYPNWVSREGQRGMEYNAWGEPKNPPRYDTELFFTRLMAGPMDYTPGIVSLKGRGNTDILSTLARQLALYVVVYSPVQMAADLQENYEASPVAFQFIKQVPVDWDETRVVSGAIGDHVVVARKDRGSDDWYVGGVTDEAARGAIVKLDFLPAGKVYTATIYRDGPTAEAGAKGKDMVVEQRQVRRGDALSIAMAPGGGFAVRLAAPSRR
ncbi:glycoside hydrolase family 97 protein [Sphingomonas sp. LY160]|uniref:glycoside hydrolase family 97 protein n=1 Tax=Sphingomonas sp. LY160 TaxID=3095342 RepID=UPI002ADECE83|nr:glycoside hydrolase family 97 protein [Sphingomonas sp. LY160]MEA1072896.1 glycoside hydrolase family 97 protein [Sphingomonas sp. LY160]